MHWWKRFSYDNKSFFSIIILDIRNARFYRQSEFCLLIPVLSWVELSSPVCAELSCCSITIERWGNCPRPTKPISECRECATCVGEHSWAPSLPIFNPSLFLFCSSHLLPASPAQGLNLFVSKAISIVSAEGGAASFHHFQAETISRQQSAIVNHEATMPSKYE